MLPCGLRSWLDDVPRRVRETRHVGIMHLTFSSSFLVAIVEDGLEWKIHFMAS